VKPDIADHNLALLPYRESRSTAFGRHAASPFGRHALRATIAHLSNARQKAQEKEKGKRERGDQRPPVERALSQIGANRYINHPLPCSSFDRAMSSELRPERQALYCAWKKPHIHNVVHCLDPPDLARISSVPTPTSLRVRHQPGLHRRQRFRLRRRRFELRQDRLERIEPRRIREGVIFRARVSGARLARLPLRR
jgi:hypothetical protein